MLNVINAPNKVFPIPNTTAASAKNPPLRSLGESRFAADIAAAVQARGAMNRQMAAIAMSAHHDRGPSYFGKTITASAVTTTDRNDAAKAFTAGLLSGGTSGARVE